MDLTFLCCITLVFLSLAQHAGLHSLFAFLHWECVALAQSLVKGSAEGKEPAGTTAITTGRLRMNTVYCWSCCLWAESWGSMTWIWNRAITKAWTTHPQQDRKDCLLGSCLLLWTVNGDFLQLLLQKLPRGDRALLIVPQNWTQAEMEDAGKWIRLWVLPAQLEPCPAATETDIHANHNRNERPGHTATRPGSHYSWAAGLPAQQTTSYPTRGSTPVPTQTDRLGQIGTIPPSITTHSSSPSRAAAASAQGANSTFRSPFVLIMLT